jgi:hypothetical protein
LAEIPVICDSCGRLWFSRKAFGGTRRITSVGAGVGPCPTCAGWGHIPDGRDAVAPGITRVLASDLTGENLGKLLNLLREAQSAGAGAGETAGSIIREVPEAAPVAALLTSQGDVLASWLALIVAIIGLIVAQTKRTGSSQRLSAKQVAQIAARAVEKSAKALRSPEPRPERRRGPMDLCWCGSGQKYKHCHGRR